MALPTNQPISADPQHAPKMRADEPGAAVPSRSTATRSVTDAEEGLILVNVDTLADGEPRNNFLKRAVTWNDGGVLNGARHITLAGEYAYIAAAPGLVVVDLDDPLKPRLARDRAARPMPARRAIQFRYLWVTDREGLKLFDVTDLRRAACAVPGGDRAARRRAHASISPAPTPMSPPSSEGLVIVDVTKPGAPAHLQQGDLRRADERRRGRDRRHRPTPRCSPMSPTAGTA